MQDYMIIHFKNGEEIRVPLQSRGNVSDHDLMGCGQHVITYQRDNGVIRKICLRSEDVLFTAETHKR